MAIIPIMIGIILMVSAFLIGAFSDEPETAIGTAMIMTSGLAILIFGALSDHEQKAMHKNNINPVVIEYITDVRNQKDETNISTSDTIAVYIECKRNGLSEEEIMLFLLPDITEDEAKSIVKTYNLLEEEN